MTCSSVPSVFFSSRKPITLFCSCAPQSQCRWLKRKSFAWNDALLRTPKREHSKGPAMLTHHILSNVKINYSTSSRNTQGRLPSRVPHQFLWLFALSSGCNTNLETYWSSGTHYLSRCNANLWDGITPDVVIADSWPRKQVIPATSMDHHSEHRLSSL